MTDIATPPPTEDLARFTAVLPLAAPAPEPQSSIEIAHNAKGAAQWTVKVYDRDPDAALATACRLYDELAQRFGTEREA
jgi:hypothetical protein